MDKQQELKSSKDIIVYLSNRFPHCFTVEGDAKPLKIGIFQDLAERLTEDERLSKTKLRSVLRSYTASWRYLYCLKAGASRVDLDGQLCEVITPEQAEHALAQLKESKEKAKANRKVIENKNKQLRSNKLNSKSMPNRASDSPKNEAKTDHKVAPKVFKSVDLGSLKEGDNIKVRLGSKVVSVIISSIDKERVKVKVPSGMELSVMLEHIVF